MSSSAQPSVYLQATSQTEFAPSSSVQQTVLPLATDQAECAARQSSVYLHAISQTDSPPSPSLHPTVHSHVISETEVACFGGREPSAYLLVPSQTQAASSPLIRSPCPRTDEFNSSPFIQPVYSRDTSQTETVYSEDYQSSAYPHASQSGLDHSSSTKSSMHMHFIDQPQFTPSMKSTAYTRDLPQTEDDSGDTASMYMPSEGDTAPSSSVHGSVYHIRQTMDGSSDSDASGKVYTSRNGSRPPFTQPSVRMHFENPTKSAFSEESQPATYLEASQTEASSSFVQPSDYVDSESPTDYVYSEYSPLQTYPEASQTGAPSFIPPSIHMHFISQTDTDPSSSIQSSWNSVATEATPDQTSILQTVDSMTEAAPASQPSSTSDPTPSFQGISTFTTALSPTSTESSSEDASTSTQIAPGTAALVTTTAITSGLTSSQDTNNATEAASSAASDSPADQGIPTKIKIAIAIPIVIFGVAILAAVLFFLLRRRRNRARSSSSTDIRAMGEASAGNEHKWTAPAQTHYTPFQGPVLRKPVPQTYQAAGTDPEPGVIPDPSEPEHPQPQVPLSEANIAAMERSEPLPQSPFNDPENESVSDVSDVDGNEHALSDVSPVTSASVDEERMQ